MSTQDRHAPSTDQIAQAMDSDFYRDLQKVLHAAKESCPDLDVNTHIGLYAAITNMYEVALINGCGVSLEDAHHVTVAVTSALVVEGGMRFVK